MAQIRKEQKLQAFDEEADHIHEYFRVNTIRKMHKGVMGVFIVILCIIFLGIISAIISGPILSYLEYSSMQKHLDKLEIMFQEQKWDEMKIYYTDNKLYNSQYVKYDEVNTLYYYCNQQYLATIELQQFMDVTYLGDLPVEEIKKLISIYMDTV